MAQSEDQPQLVNINADPYKVLPKLCTKILLEQVSGNTVLTFIYDVGPETAQVIDRIVVDEKLKRQLLDSLKRATGTDELIG